MANEHTQLIPGKRIQSKNKYIKPFCECLGGHICTKSKAATLTLVWVMSVSIIMGLIDPSVYFGYSLPQVHFTINWIKFDSLLYGGIALIHMLFPVAGFMADVCWGRYKTIVWSLWILLLALFVVTVASVIYLELNFEKTVFLIGGLIAIAFATFGYVGFFANIIQFGLDQLQDYPAEHSSLYIHWYVWIYYFWVGLCKVMANSISCRKDLTKNSMKNIFLTTIIPWPTICFIILFVSLCLICFRHTHRWFIVDQGSQNPYKLVYKVLKFAYKHKYPIQRSAFTYCEDELPARIDLAKNKYGGPFTTEEVEDVKAFIGIVRVLLTLGPFFMVDLAVFSLLQVFSWNWILGDKCDDFGTFLIFQQLTLTPILIVVLIPLYILFLRPFVISYLPGMLKRIGIGMILVLLSLLCTFTTDTVGHISHPNATCMFERNWEEFNQTSLFFNQAVLLPQNILNALGYMFFYTAAYEFMCAQSPHAMKGLLVGIFFAIKGVFQLLTFAVILLPFVHWGCYWHSHFPKPSCGSVYYFVNIVIAIVGLVAYTLVARRYRYRQRNEPSHLRIYQFAEDYYEKTSRLRYTERT